MKRKYIRRTLWVIASPFILFIVLGILVYVPPVQNFLVDKAAVYASEAIGMHIAVGRISLSFPLNLVVTDIHAASLQNDTLLHVERLQLNVQLLPLLKKDVEVDGISLKGVTVDSNDLIDGMQLSGTLGELFVSSHGVELDPETAIVNKVLLKDADLSLCLNDTTASADTTASDTLYWKIALHEIDFQNVSLSLDMPLDTLSLSASWKEAALRNGLVDLHKEAYSLETFRITNGRVKYDSGISLADSLPKGFDPNHLTLTGIGVELDSLHYEGKNMKAIISRFTWKESSGLELVSTKGRLVSDEHTLRIPSLKMETPDSYLELNVSVDWEALEPDGNGNMSARLMADIGKPDVMHFLTDMDPQFVRQYPTEPIRIRTGLDGNLSRLKLTTLSAELPGALELFAKGELINVTDSLQRVGDMRLEAETKDLQFVTSLVEGVEIPYNTRLEGQFTLAGSKIGTDLLLTQPEFHATESDSIPVAAIDTLFVSGDLAVPRAVHLLAEYDLSCDGYAAELVVRDFDLHPFLPTDSLHTLSARLQVTGKGLDFLSSETQVKTEAKLEDFCYGNYDLSGISLGAALEQSKIQLSLTAKTDAIDVTAHMNGQLKSDNVSANLNMNIAQLDWQTLNLTETRFLTSQHLGIRFSSDLQKRHVVEAEMTEIQITATKGTFQAKDLFAGFATSQDSTSAYLRSGDLNLSFKGEGDVERLSEEATELLAKLAEQWDSKTIEQEVLRGYLPALCVKISSGSDNPVADYLSTKGIAYNQLFMDMCASPINGLNGEARFYGLQTDSLVLDTIYLDIRQNVEGITMTGGIGSGAKPKQEAFDVMLEGNVGNSSAQLLLQYFNAQKEQGVCLGVKADLRRRGISLKLFPENPVLVYRPFTVNADNFIYLSDEGRIRANVELYDDQGTGMSFYTNREDTLATQDMTLELVRINLEEFRRILPYMPDVGGWIGAEAHYVDSDGSLMVSGDMSVEDFTYEGSKLGDWELGGVYLPGDLDDFHVNAYVRHDKEEIVRLDGVYFQPEEGPGGLSGKMEFLQFPLNVANPFVPDHMVELAGNINGILAMKGDLSKPMLNGELALDSVAFSIPEMSATFRLDNEPVSIVNSRMTFNEFDIFTNGKTPFSINGDVDFSDLERITVDLQMFAEDYELLNAPRTKRSMIYGKLYVDFDATLRGPLESLVMRGNMNILGKTDFTYILRDSPLAVNDRLGDMVTFVNFNDTTAVDEDVQSMALVGMDIAMTMHIDQAVQARVDLVEDGSNYMLLEGGGDLSFQYTPQGDMVLTGRYSLISGEMKYEIPIIPLKTFNIRNGSYVEWTGNIMNPQLSIIATERVRASVGEEGQASRMVGFDVGIALSERLENLGLAFTLEAPEDATVQEQLNAMSVEEQGKLAVTMLVTGMYLAEGNSTGGFNVNNALNSFLQNEISNIAGKALDINVGMETVDDADSGGTHTDYNFQFAKRFWNNRFRIVIGGTVSTGNTAQQDESFIDNVSIEYRLDNSGTRYVKLFHDKNYESVLEGEITETGVGIVLRKKISHLSELFIFKTKKKKQD